MSPIAKETIDMISLLPEQEQKLINELVKRVFIALDPDYTKLTAEEQSKLLKAEEDIKNGDIVDHNDINWD